MYELKNQNINSLTNTQSGVLNSSSNPTKMSKKIFKGSRSLDLYIKELKEKYDIPINYVTGELLQKTKNKEIVINNKTFKIDLPNIWRLKESSNTEYQIHTLNQIIQSQISLFFYKESDINIIKYCIEVIENWFDNNKKIELLKWYDKMNANWQDMSTSYRLGNILLVYELAIKFNVDINKEKFRVEILYHIEWLKSHLVHNKKLSFSSNHNLFISRYLILGSYIYNIYFNKLEDSYITLGIENFIEAISNNVDMTDVLSKEHSTNYHILYYRQLNKLLSIIDEDNKNYKTLKDLSDKMYNNLNYFIYPNNHFVQIGDTDDKLCNYEFKDLVPLKIFKNVGYGVYKKNNIYLSLSCSYHSSHHKHMDELSINYYNECPILIEGGRYSYDEKKLKDKLNTNRHLYYLSQRSKNNIVVDDDYLSIYNANLQYLISNNKNIIYESGIIDSSYNNNSIQLYGMNPILKLAQNIQHNRIVNLDENGILFVEDKLVSQDKKEHKSTRHFHFHFDWELVEIVKNTVIFKHKKLNKILEFKDLSNGEINYYYGQEKPFIQGFTSDYEHHKIEIPTIEIVNTFKRELKLVSKLQSDNNNYNSVLINNKLNCVEVENKSAHFFSKDNTKLYCLNCCPIRRKHMLRQLENNYINYEIVNGFTDNNLLLRSNKSLSNTKVNISLGFYKIFEKFYFDKNIKYAIICEDDIIFEDTELINLLNKYSVNNIKTNNFIIYGCCLFTCSSKNNELGKSIFKNTFKCIETPAKFGNPCFIITKKYAELILENFYPIKEPFDNYMKQIINDEKNKIKSFYLDPFICYELSSGYYEYLYKEKDQDLLKSFPFKRLSCKNNIKNDIFNYNKYMGQNFGDTLNTYIFNKINYKLISHDNDKHFLLIGSILNQKVVKNTSIICGAGIIKENVDFALNKPMTTIMVRGPHTRNSLIQKGIYCPKNYGDVGMLINNIYPKKVFPKFKLGIIPHICDFDHFFELFKNNKEVCIISLKCKYDKVESVIDEIVNCEYIISTSLHGIITGHAYKKKVLWLSSYKGLFGDNIKFMDYYDSLECFNTNPYNYKQFIELKDKFNFIENIIKKIKIFPQPNLEIFESLKYKMKKLLPFYYELFQTKIVIITRFGINMKDKEWYDYRYIVHKAFGQSCILNQTNQNFEWLICLDINPPEDFLLKLKRDFKSSKNIHLLHIKNDFISEYRSYIEENILTNKTNKLIIMRKDDDDALNVNFIENIYDYLQNNEINLHFIEENNKNFTRIQDWRDKWYWGDKIINLFDNKQEIINQLFFSRNGNEEIKVYYKNDYIQSFGSPTKYGSIENQLLTLKYSVEKNIDKSFTPFAIINNPSFGFQYRYEENKDKFYKSDIPGTAVGIYSILPTKDKKITNYRDGMYENRWGHTKIFKTKGAKFNNININNISNYIFVRGLINDCGEDIKHRYCIDNKVINLTNNIINDFSINKKFLQEFKDINKKYNNVSVKKFKYIVDKNIKKY